MSLRLITAPPVTPVSLAEAKAHCRVDDTNSDAVITDMIVDATTLIEEVLNRALVEQVWELVLDEFPVDAIQLPLPPLIAVVSVGYLDEDGDAQTLIEGTDYAVDTASVPGWVVLAADTSWPTTFDGINAVTVRFRAGYASGSPIDGEAVPGPIRRAMLLQVATWFDNREAIGENRTAAAITASGGEGQLAPVVRAILSPYRVWR